MQAAGEPLSELQLAQSVELAQVMQQHLDSCLPRLALVQQEYLCDHQASPAELRAVVERGLLQQPNGALLVAALPVLLALQAQQLAADVQPLGP